jgi:sterol desaturase/sphingolipid hydroxylase (fatty acid hydroxylase superfamily)
MELYGKIVFWAMPLFLLFVLLEKGYGVRKGKDTYNNMDMVSSLSSGVTNVVKDVLGLSVSLLSYPFLLKHLAVFHLSSSILLFAVAFIVLDFQGYWVHRWAHQINFFWNKHVIHHSSEEFNLACALRQSVSSFVNLFTFFLVPAAVLGVPVELIAVVGPIHLFAQFWYHTRHIGKMGFLEKIIVTPSHHRVHHAINPEYIDKNHGQIFIVWDKLFGTFQEELDTVPPVYGITRPARTWNPITINFQHFSLLVKDAWRTKNLKDKLRIWWQPTGWRPSDVAEAYPVHIVQNVYELEKYDTEADKTLHLWIWVQLSFTLFLTMYFFASLGKIKNLQELLFYSNTLLYGFFIFLSVYAYAELMDRKQSALGWELFRNLLGAYVIIETGDWFGISDVLPFADTLILLYFVLSSLVTAYFTLKTFATPKSVLS